MGELQEAFYLRIRNQQLSFADRDYRRTELESIITQYLDETGMNNFLGLGYESLREKIEAMHRNYDNFDDYLRISQLQDGYCYKILARNAYVGIWLASKNGFLISRYKVGAKPYLFVEFHEDTEKPTNTVKPIVMIEQSPFSSQQLSFADRDSRGLS